MSISLERRMAHIDEREDGEQRVDCGIDGEGSISNEARKWQVARVWGESDARVARGMLALVALGLENAPLTSLLKLDSKVPLLT